MLAAMFLALSLPLAQAPAPGSAAQTAARAAVVQAAEPMDCGKALPAFVSKRRQEVQPPTGFTPELLKQFDEEKFALAKSCAAHFDSAAIVPAQLAGLSELYLAARQPDEGHATLARAREPKGDERNARLEKLIDELDTGYDEANEPRLAAMVAKLVAEPDQAPGVISVPLEYRAPGDGPKPNFSPKGTPVALTPVAPNAPLPAGAGRPAKAGTIQIGPDKKAWFPVLVAADAQHPQDLCNLFLDRNRNGNFADDGPAISAAPTQNEKTKAWWTSFNKIELSIPYSTGARPEPYLVNFWIVRDGDNPPDVIRYSVGSWRYGKATVGGVEALVAAMDADNDAVFGKGDYWSILEASAAAADTNVLSHAEARSTSRLMFVKDGDREQVLEFRSFSPDGRRVDFAIVDRPVTRAADRAGDDVVKDERPRPRTTAPFSWGHDFAAALARAKTSGKKLFVDFEATWCGPCKTMDEWIWTDAEVASQLNAGFIGVKLDGDVEKALVKRFAVKGYPTMLVLDAAGAEANRGVGYLSSKDVLALLNARR